MKPGVKGTIVTHMVAAMVYLKGWVSVSVVAAAIACGPVVVHRGNVSPQGELLSKHLLTKRANQLGRTLVTLAQVSVQCFLQREKFTEHWDTRRLFLCREDKTGIRQTTQGGKTQILILQNFNFCKGKYKTSQNSSPKITPKLKVSKCQESALEICMTWKNSP